MKIQEVLLNTYLDLSHEGANLRSMAYSKAIIWILYAEGKPLDFNEIKKDVAQLVGSNGLPKESIEEALEILKSRKAVFLSRKAVFLKDKKWDLNPTEKEKIKKQIDYSSGVTDRIIRDRFLNEIDKNQIRNWFDYVNSQYFSAGADKLIALYTSHKKPLCNVESVIKPAIKKFGFSKYEKELLQGYKEFLMSDDREEGEKVLNLMRSLLSSRLISANIGPESLSIERYRNADILLDTNVLFAMRLHRGEDLDQAFKALSKVTKSLGAIISIGEFTSEEYEKVRIREKGRFIEIINSYPKGIFEGMGQNKDITKTLLSLGCEKSDDIERFFDTELAMPKDIGDVKISILTGAQLKGSYYSPEPDKLLLKEIKEATFHKRGKDKIEDTAIHDLRLMKLAKKRRQSRNTLVLTLDGAMEALALEKVSEKEDPLWMSLYSFIQILAINGAGPDFNPNDLAPFIKMFMEFEESTNEDKYDERDLLLLVERTERISELPETQIISLLNKLHRIRLKRPGSDKEAVRQITLDLDRALRYNANKSDDALREKQTVIEDLKSENEQLDVKFKGAVGELQSMKTKKTIFWFIVRVVIYLMLAGLLAFYMKSDLLAAYNQDSHYDLVSILSVIGAVAIFGVTDYFTYTKSKLEKIKKQDA